MVSVEERMKVLNLLQTGAITAEQAAQLLQAMETGQPAPAGFESAASDVPPEPAEPAAPYAMPQASWEDSAAPAAADAAPAAVTVPAPAPSGHTARWLHVRVSDMNSGRPRVNVRLPLTLVGFGLKMGRQFAPEMEGMDIDELARVLQSGEPGPFVDVYDEDDGEHVEVFLE